MPAADAVGLEHILDPALLDRLPGDRGGIEVSGEAGALMPHLEDRTSLEEHRAADARIGRQVRGELGKDLGSVVVVLFDPQRDRVGPMPLSLGESRRLTSGWH